MWERSHAPAPCHSTTCLRDDGAPQIQDPFHPQVSKGDMKAQTHQQVSAAGSEIPAHTKLSLSVRKAEAVTLWDSSQLSEDDQTEGTQGEGPAVA